ncbi:MAG: DUF3857 domain-containing protein [Kofleriaceae bacterium]|nr:DUF3857 domain-containing protein [Kofleriaceae bacterium]
MRMVVLVCAFVAVATGLAGAGPLDKPAFTATPAELLAEARAAKPAGHAVAILREDVTFTFDARGRVERRYRTVFTVVEPSGADDWGTIGLDWQPFYQDKPTIRARVINLDGSVTDFDPALMHDAPAVNESPTVFSDRRDLTAPLPRLAVGAVVEEEFVFPDREPLLAAGTVHWIGPQRDVPIPRKVITISSPTALKATVVTRGPAIAWKPTTRTGAGRTVVTYDLANLQPYDDGAVGAPVDWIPYPMIGIATGASWAAIAADYRALVEAKLAAPVTVPADLLAATPRATVDRIVAWLHGRVRYTGIELSQSAIVPFAPADTLARGFGDCKDKATLLVALLRAAKIPADVALLSTGPGTDVDVALPGMGEFDHAIVRAIVDGKDLWIDATEDLLPAGQLPVRDQGRRALIIAAGTKALTTTPASKPADNLIREVRTFRLPEQGTPSVSEVTEERGYFSGNLRGFVRNNTKADADKAFASYVADEYQGSYRSFTSSDPHDLTRPFTLTIEGADVGRGGAQRGQVWVWLFPSDVLDKLPDSLGGGDADVAAQVAGRKVDYVWSYPHTYEITNRIELPPGFAPPELPAAETRTLGTMTLTTTRARVATGYTVTYRLDTGKARISADELRAGRAAVAKLRDEGATQVLATLDAAQLAQQGKVREAIAEYRRLIALHPKEALHHDQLALLYLSVGQGDAARREARLATKVEPGAGDGWMVLGHVLARDLTGRRGAPGADRRAAEAAYRKALALTPTHVGAHSDLAALITADATGHVKRDPAVHREAAALLRPLRPDGDGAYDERIADALAMAGDAAALEAFAHELPDGPVRRKALTVAAGMTDGAAAVRQATALVSANDRDDLLQRAAATLVAMRRYDAARAIHAARVGVPVAYRAAMDRLRPIDLAKLPPRDPTTVATLVMQRLTVGPVAKPPWSADTEAALAEIAAGVIGGFTTTDLAALSSDVLLDVMHAVAPGTVRGDAKAGWDVTIDFMGRPFTLYVVLRDQRAYLIGGNALTAGVGREAIDRIAHKDLAGARAWLTRLADDVTPLPGVDELDLLKRHRTDLAAAPAPVLETIAWSLFAPHAPRAGLASLRACGGLTADADRDACLSVAMSSAGHLGDWRLAAEVAREALALPVTDTATAGARAIVAAHDGGSKLAAARVTELLAATPDDLELKRARAVITMVLPWPEAAPVLDQLTAGPTAEPEDLNNGAWTHLFYDAKPDAARALIERTMARLNEPPRNVRNTYAAVLAEMGDPAAAWHQVELGLDATSPPDNGDWYVIGRIAENLDLRDDAIAAYRRVAGGSEPPGLPSNLDFAQKRLKALGVTP